MKNILGFVGCLIVACPAERPMIVVYLGPDTDIITAGEKGAMLLMAI